MAQYHVYEADISPYAQQVVLQLEIKKISFTLEHPPGGFDKPDEIACDLSSGRWSTMKFRLWTKMTPSCRAIGKVLKAELWVQAAKAKQIERLNA